MQGVEFGAQRVRDLLAAHHQKPAAELGSLLLDAVREFAGDAPQEDDMTIVLVKRAGAAARRSFKRGYDSLEAIFAFTAQTMGEELRRTVDVVLEELFTNLVKYGRPSEAPVQIDISPIAGGVHVTLTDPDAEPFDIARAPDADINQPVDERKPGGLGIHLVRRMVDSIEYRYSAQERTSRIAFRKTEKRDADD